MSPMHTDWCTHIVKPIEFNSSADYKTIYVADQGSIYFWLHITATQRPDWATGSESSMIYTETTIQRVPLIAIGSLINKVSSTFD